MKTALVVTWWAAIPAYKNGNITGYEIHYERIASATSLKDSVPTISKNVTVKETSLNVEYDIVKLSQGKRYKIKVNVISIIQINVKSQVFNHKKAGLF